MFCRGDAIINNCYNGKQLITIGTAIAFKIADCTDADSLGVLGALFSVIGDQLALLSATKENSLSTATTASNYD